MKAGPGPRGDRGRGARPGGPGHRGPGRPLRRPRLGRHLAGLGGRRGRLRARERWWATTSAASPTPTTSRRRRGPGRPWWPPTSGWPPGSATPTRATTTWWPTCAPSWPTGPARARAAGIPPDRIVLDAGLDLGKTAEQSLTLLRGSPTLAGLGYPLLLSASNKTFLGVLLDLELTDRRDGLAVGRRPRGHARLPGAPGPRRGRHLPGARRAGRAWPEASGEPRWRPDPMPGPAARRPTTRPAYLVRGDDPRSSPRPPGRSSTAWSANATRPWWSRSTAARRLDDLDVGAVIDACTTPALPGRPPGGGGPRRRPAGGGRRRPAGGRPGRPGPPSTVLVLVAGGGTVPSALVKAVGRPARSSTRRWAPAGTGAGGWPSSMHGAPVRLDAGLPRPGWASTWATTWAGCRGCSETLAAAYGDGATIDADQLEPFLGEAGAVPPWDLTDAIDAAPRRPRPGHPPPHAGGRRAGAPRDRGHPAPALRQHAPARRSRGDGGRGGGPPSRDAQRLPGQEGPGAGPAPGRGTDRSRPSPCWPTADLDVKGQSALPAELVLEILVARLSPIAAGPARRPAGADQPGRRSPGPLGSAGCFEPGRSGA